MGAPRTVAHVTAMDHDAALEHPRVRDHRIVLGIVARSTKYFPAAGAARARNARLSLQDVEARRQLNAVAGPMRTVAQLPPSIEVFTADPGPLIEEPVQQVHSDVIETVIGGCRITRVA